MESSIPELPGKTVDQQIVDNGKSGGGEEICVHDKGKGSTDEGEGSTDIGKGSTDEGKGSTAKERGQLKCN